MEEFIVKDWINVVLRWVHIMAGIMWVGQTYLFNWMENRFAESLDANTPKNSGGNLWMVHGGGFYFTEKQKKPVKMPQTLHWFKWESFFTWLSGFLLLVLVYYMGGLMLAPDSEMSELAAAGIGLGTLIVGTIAYNILWYHTPLNKNEVVFAIVCWVLIVGLTYYLNQYLSTRATYMHIGALFGTIMVTNVWMRIMPAQKAMVSAIEANKEPDMTRGLKAKQCSKHNTFMSIPLVFIMISNHYPITTYGHQYNWIILGVLILLGWGAAKLIRDH